jgi:hypothetical protein
MLNYLIKSFVCFSLMTVSPYPYSSTSTLDESTYSVRTSLLHGDTLYTLTGSVHYQITDSPLDSLYITAFLSDDSGNHYSMLPDSLWGAAFWQRDLAMEKVLWFNFTSRNKFANGLTIRVIAAARPGPKKYFTYGFQNTAIQDFLNIIAPASFFISYDGARRDYSVSNDSLVVSSSPQMVFSLTDEYHARKIDGQGEEYYLANAGAWGSGKILAPYKAFSPTLNIYYNFRNSEAIWSWELLNDSANGTGYEMIPAWHPVHDSSFTENFFNGLPHWQTRVFYADSGQKIRYTATSIDGNPDLSVSVRDSANQLISELYLLPIQGTSLSDTFVVSRSGFYFVKIINYGGADESLSIKFEYDDITYTSMHRGSFAIDSRIFSLDTNAIALEDARPFAREDDLAISPNPFNPTAHIHYRVNVAGRVAVSIYDCRGKLVRTLVNESKKTGSYQASWPANNLTSGIYMVRLINGNKSCIRKALYVK